MSLVYDQNGEPRYFGVYRGFVADNKDPDKTMRVRVTVPGLIDEPSKWAWPMGTGGGGWDPPKVGAGVLIQFHQGDIDEPHYILGWYARDQAPETARGASTDDAADKIKCFETERHLVVLDGRAGEEQIVIKDKSDSSMTLVLKGGKVYVGGDSLDFKAGILNGEAKDPSTGLKHWMLGNASRTVRAKK